MIGLKLNLKQMRKITLFILNWIENRINEGLINFNNDQF